MPLRNLQRYMQILRIKKFQFQPARLIKKTKQFKDIHMAASAFLKTGVVLQMVLRQAQGPQGQRITHHSL